MAEAVSIIKEHDNYALELEEKKRKEDTEPVKPVRHLKVCESSGRNYKTTPTITLKGDWLRSWGFNLGEEVNVVYEGDGKLLITTES